MIVSRTIGALVISSFLPVEFSQLFDQLSQWQLNFNRIRKEAKLYKFKKKNYFCFPLTIFTLVGCLSKVPEKLPANC